MMISTQKIDLSLIRSLHFMMMSFDMTKLPGQWRPTPVYVVSEADEEVIYEGPSASDVPKYMAELVDQMAEAENVESSSVLGAMAHLNLAMIHPFKDGNGRMARALQTLFISRNGVSSPTFCSIEEWLGRNTPAYYAILKEVGQGRWNPRNSALPWIRFCLIAHYQQSTTLSKRNDHVGRVWNEIRKIVQQHGLPERVEVPLLDGTFSYRVRSNRYREDVDISDVVATRDLRKLCDLDLLVPIGEKRGRYYVGGKTLLSIAERTRDSSRAGNPYEIAAKGRSATGQLNLL